MMAAGKGEVAAGNSNVTARNDKEPVAGNSNVMAKNDKVTAGNSRVTARNDKVPAARNGVTVTRTIESASSWDGAPLPRYPAGTPLVTILRYTVAPHARLPLHRHPVINAGAVLRGELTVVAEDGRERTFRAGEGIVEMVGTLHYGENRGDEPIELVMFYAGSEGLPLSEKP